MTQQKILFVLTGHDRLGEAGDEKADKTGFHLFEAARPWVILKDAGFSIDIVTPEGGSAPIDPSSMDLDDADSKRFIDDPEVARRIRDSASLKSVDLESYDAIYFPGGHGTMWDLPNHPAVENATRSMYEAGKVVAAVCHGPAAIVNVRLSDGSWLVEGKRMSAFTDREERETGKDGMMPFMLSGLLAEHGAILESAENFEASVSIDGKLATGQNPASAAGVAEAIRDLLN